MLRAKLRRLRDKDTRKLIGLIMAGKMLGIGILLLCLKGFGWYFSASASAAVLHHAAVTADQTVSPINTIWVLVTAFLVFFMQAGFMGLEAGFARSRETVNVLMECVFDTCLCGILYWAFGFAFQFGVGNGFIGHQYFWLHGATAAYGTTGVAFLAFWLFQFAFADTASTVTSGAMVGRTAFVGDIYYSIAVSGFLYPIFGHWAWGPGGWLGNLPAYTSGLLGVVSRLAGSTAANGVFFRDFAGSTVVHTVGGVIALAGAIALGPRLGRKFKRDGGGAMPPHDLTWGAIGGVILWFGWYGFNPGSTLSAMDWQGIGRVSANTTIAACAGGMMAVLFAFPKLKKWDLGLSVNGFLGGLVAITCPCYWVTPGGAVWIGAIAGIVVVLGIDLLEYLRIDDPIGAVPVHMFAGMWGTLSLGLFGASRYGVPTATGFDKTFVVKGLFYGGGLTQLRAQFVGSMACVIAVGGVALIIMMFLMKVGVLRLSKEHELEGMDLVEHGTAAYHVEFGMGMTYTTAPNIPHSNGKDTLEDAEPVGVSSGEDP
jgi:Amt family ammonium transporter